MGRTLGRNYEIIEKLGSGAFGLVWKVVGKATGKPYAIKEIDLTYLDEKEQLECVSEVEVLSLLDSSYIIKYYDSFLEQASLYIVTEYAAGGTLHSHLTKARQRGEKLPENVLWKLLIQLSIGLSHMHSKRILHRDIKPLNIFLDDQMHVKIGDLGVSRVLSATTKFAKTLVGTPYYLSPEMCEGRGYDDKSDMWALGVVMYEAATFRVPFEAHSQPALVMKILSGKYPPISGYSSDLVDIIYRCLNTRFRSRPSADQLLSFPSVRRHAVQLDIELPPGAAMPQAPLQPLSRSPTHTHTHSDTTLPQGRSSQDSSLPPSLLKKSSSLTSLASGSSSPSRGSSTRFKAAKNTLFNEYEAISASPLTGVSVSGQSVSLTPRTPAPAKQSVHHPSAGGGSASKSSTPSSAASTPSSTRSCPPSHPHHHHHFRSNSRDSTTNTSAKEATTPIGSATAASHGKGERGDKESGHSRTGDTDRKAEVRRAIPDAVAVQRNACVKMMGPDLFDKLYGVVKSGAPGGVASGGDINTKLATPLPPHTHASLAALQKSPEQVKDVIHELVKLLYLEEQFKPPPVEE